MIDTWARMVRRTCPTCGSGLIQWVVAVDLPFLIPDLEERKHAVHAIQVYGGDADAWRCGRCGNFGMFGPTERML